MFRRTFWLATLQSLATIFAAPECAESPSGKFDQAVMSIPLIKCSWSVRDIVYNNFHLKIATNLYP
jgi:hypothetical protein